MSRQEIQDAYPSKKPVFKGTNYDFWKVRIEAYLMSLRIDVWSNLLVNYDFNDVLPTNENNKNVYGNNVKATNSFLFSLSQSELVNVMHFNSTKEVWVKLNQSDEGDHKLKKQKLQTFRMRFESVRHVIC